MFEEHRFLRDKILVITACCQERGFVFADVLEILLQQGALDVYYEPIITGKGPAAVITVLCSPAQEHLLIDTLHRHAAVNELSCRRQDRYKLHREFISVEVSGCSIRVKCGYTLQQGRKHYWQMAPEYEDCKDAARRSGQPIQAIYRQALKLVMSLEF